MASLYTGLYFLSYQVFFLQLPFEDIVERRHPRFDEQTSWRWPTEEMVYPGYAYFDAIRLEPGTDDGTSERITASYVSPRILDHNPGKQIEFFVNTERDRESTATGPFGVLEVIQIDRNGTEHVSRIELVREDYQRHSIDWVIQPLDDYQSFDGLATQRQRMQFQVVDANDDLSAVLFSTNIRVSFLGQALGYLGLAGLFIGALLLTRPRHIPAGFVATAFGALVMFWLFHSGAWVSNVYISSIASQSGSGFTAMHSLGTTGEFPLVFYHEPLVVVMGFATWIVEGAGSIVHSEHFSQTYPTPRLLMFLLLFGCFLSLLWAVYTHMGAGVAAVMAAATPLFFPFIIDLYNFPIDSYLIPLFMPFLAALIHGVYRQRFSLPLIAGMAVVLTAMASFKITPMVLAVIVPVGLLLSRAFGWSRIRMLQVAVLAIALFAAYPASNAINGMFVDGARMAIPEHDIPFASTNFWKVVWGANGTYDAHSAHGFVRGSGRLRSERVRAATGMPSASGDYSALRHSQLATDELYRPAVLHALRETPNFFYSTAMVRAYRHGSVFIQYPRGGGREWLRWRPNREGQQNEIDTIRRNKMWKIAPLVLLTKMVQFDMPRFADWVLISLAVIGALLVPRRELAVIFLGIIAAKYASMATVHVLVRYFNFGNVVLLLTLSVFVYAHFLWLREHMQRAHGGRSNHSRRRREADNAVEHQAPGRPVEPVAAPPPN